MNKIYTGRQVALFTDIHGLLEPIEAILDDIKRRGINIVYSLGDNIIDGPDSFNVVKLLELNGVKCIAGNTEEYIRIGIEPFCSYMNSNREKEINSLREELSNLKKNEISLLAVKNDNLEMKKKIEYNY